MSESYMCPTCGELVSLKRSELHNHYLNELENSLNQKRFLTIREGKMPIEEWKEPDLYVVQNMKLLRIIEVIVGDPYENGDNSVKSKIVKIKKYYNPPEIVIFEPVSYLDIFRLPEMKDSYQKTCGFTPTSYNEIQNFYREKWKKEGLDVTFWDESEISI